jgi:hypothetical protein
VDFPVFSRAGGAGRQLTSPASDTTPTWVFERQGERLTIRRVEILTLTVTGSAREDREYSFDNTEELAGFRSGFESHLIGNGWSPVSFSPERRKGADRRGTARNKPERRRTFPFFRRA